jgi:hypothetical protein
MSRVPIPNVATVTGAVVEAYALTKKATGGGLPNLSAMRRIHSCFVIAALIGLPLAAHAAGAAPLSRDEVRAQLIEAELSGKIPQSKTHYPDPFPNPALVYAARKAVAETSFGPSMAAGSDASGTSARGRSESTASPASESLYRGR